MSGEELTERTETKGNPLQNSTFHTKICLSLKAESDSLTVSHGELDSSSKVYEAMRFACNAAFEASCPLIVSRRNGKSKW